MNTRVAHQPFNIANQTHEISQALKEIGVKSKTCIRKSEVYGYSADINLELDKLRYSFQRNLKIFSYLISSLPNTDIYHFHGGNFFQQNFLDLKFLKALRRKMVIHFYGSEIRQKSIAELKNPYVLVKNEDEAQIKYNLSQWSKYIDTAIVYDHESKQYVENYFKNIILIKQAVNLKNYNPYYPAKNLDKVRIVHAPTSKSFKGTKHVNSVIKKISEIHDIDYVEVHGFSHSKARKIYESADLIIDQLIWGVHGVFSVEAMALGKPVICFIRDDLRKSYPKELPIISSNPDNLYEVLNQLLDDKNSLNNIGIKGREYVEKFHDSRLVAKQLLDIYKKI